MSRTQRHVIRRGAIKATIHARHTAKRTHLRLGVCRLIRDGDRWRQSSRFSVSDLPLLRLVLEEGYAWMLAQQQSTADTQKAATSRSDGRQTHAQGH
jgi:hypothetical protein